MERFWFWLVSKLPKKILYYSTVMLWADASTSDEFSNKTITSIKLIEALKFFEDKYNLFK